MRSALALPMVVLAITPLSTLALAFAATYLKQRVLGLLAIAFGLISVALTLAVTGKKMGFRALLEIEDPRLPTPTLQNLFDRAEQHARELEELRVKCTGVLTQK